MPFDMYKTSKYIIPLKMQEKTQVAELNTQENKNENFTFILYRIVRNIQLL